MILDQEDTVQQQELLAVHRRRLAYLLQQQTRLGDYTPSYVSLEIEDTQTAIHDLKAKLRASGVTVDDHPNDTARPVAPEQRIPLASGLFAKQLLQTIVG